MRHFIVAALITLSLPAVAETLASHQARTLTLRNATAVVYYTQGEAGFEVVTTVAASETATPVRLVHLLARGQSVAVEIPGPLGTPAGRLTLTRVGDTLRIDTAPDQTASPL